MVLCVPGLNYLVFPLNPLFRLRKQGRDGKNIVPRGAESGWDRADPGDSNPGLLYGTHLIDLALDHRLHRGVLHHFP